MSGAPTAGPDRCPRCGGGFACGVAGPAPCACSQVGLTPALRAALRARYPGCLCPGCLRALAAGAPLQPEYVVHPPSIPAPARPG